MGQSIEQEMTVEVDEVEEEETPQFKITDEQ